MLRGVFMLARLLLLILISMAALWVLHDGEAAAALDRKQARSAVVKHATQHHSNYPGRAADRGGAEQGIDRGARFSRGPRRTCR